MALSEIFSVPFLLSIVITCILVAAVSFLFYNKLQQQSAKINAIMDLTTTLVSEVNTIKSAGPPTNITPSNNGGGGDNLEKTVVPGEDVHKIKVNVPYMPLGVDSLDPLIDVSEDDDGESSDGLDSSDEDSDEEADDSEEESDSDDNDSEEHGDSEEDGDNEDSKVKIIQSLNSDMLSNIDISDNIADINDIDEDSPRVEELSEEDIEVDTTNLDFEKVALEQDNEELESVPDEDIGIKSESKVIEIGEQDLTDYSKYTVTELRKIAFSRGLIGDNEKPTKNKLIKILSPQ